MEITMNTLVIYDSLSGNTKIIAEAIASAIPDQVTLVHVGEVDPSQIGTQDLLIIGAPTHGGNASDPVKELLENLPTPGEDSAKVAAFDTRMPNWWLKPFGFAGPKITSNLEKKGWQVLVPGEGFIVSGGEGPLMDGEEQRARTWAEGIVELMKVP
jgi:flavodoxin